MAGDPDGVTVAGLNVHVAPAGNPEQAKLTVELKPYSGVKVRFSDPWPPEFTLRKLGEADRAKVAGGGAPTVSITVVVFVTPPLTPASVRV